MNLGMIFEFLDFVLNLGMNFEFLDFNMNLVMIFEFLDFVLNFGMLLGIGYNGDFIGYKGDFTIKNHSIYLQKSVTNVCIDHFDDEIINGQK